MWEVSTYPPLDNSHLSTNSNSNKIPFRPVPRLLPPEVQYTSTIHTQFTYIPSIFSISHETTRKKKKKRPPLQRRCSPSELFPPSLSLRFPCTYQEEDRKWIWPEPTSVCSKEMRIEAWKLQRNFQRSDWGDARI